MSAASTHFSVAPLLFKTDQLVTSLLRLSSLTQDF